MNHFVLLRLRVTGNRHITLDRPKAVQLMFLRTQSVLERSIHASLHYCQGDLHFDFGGDGKILHRCGAGCALIRKVGPQMRTVTP